MGPGNVQRRYGCAHYERKCELFCEKCQEYFPCRFCHDAEKYDTVADASLAHQFDRYGVKKIRCLVCTKEQSPKEFCENPGCGVRFASYYCATCILYDDKGHEKGNYHCDGCGLCRTGGRENFFHCDTCSICLSLSTRDKHVCIKGRTDADCPICLENLHLSTRPASLLPCGHALHSDCYSNYVHTNYRCPLCKMSLGNMSRRWRAVDEEIAALELTQPLEAPWVKALCYDCRKVTPTRRCLNQHKCLAKKETVSEEEYQAAFASSNPRAYLSVVCGSYNTDLEKGGPDVTPLTTQLMWPWDQFRIEKSLESEITAIEGSIATMNEHLSPALMMVFAKDLDFMLVNLKACPYLDAHLVEKAKERINAVLELNREYEDFLEAEKGQLLEICGKVHETAPYYAIDVDISKWSRFFKRLPHFFGIRDLDALSFPESLMLQIFRQSVILTLRGGVKFATAMLNTLLNDRELSPCHEKILQGFLLEIDKAIAALKTPPAATASDDATVTAALATEDTSAGDMPAENAPAENAPADSDMAAQDASKDITSDASKNLIFSLLFIHHNLLERSPNRRTNVTSTRLSFARRPSCEAGLCDDECPFCCDAFYLYHSDGSGDLSDDSSDFTNDDSDDEDSDETTDGGSRDGTSGDDDDDEVRVVHDVVD